MTTNRPLQGIGYWIDTEVLDYNAEARKLHEHALGLPDPRCLLATLGPQPADPRLIAYLRSGQELQACLGYSYCRFDCGVDEEELGCRDLTDGQWVWPEGLWHYVQAHEIALPEAFIATAAHNHWQVPQPPLTETLRHDGWSLEFWQRWYAQKVGGPET